MSYGSSTGHTGVSYCNNQPRRGNQRYFTTNKQLILKQ